MPPPSGWPAPRLSLGGLLPTELPTTRLSDVMHRLARLGRQRQSRESLPRTAKRKRGCLRGASGSQDAWESCRRLQPAVSVVEYHHWTPGFLVSLTTLSTCVGGTVGRVKISFISSKKNSPFARCLREHKPLLLLRMFP